MGVVDCGPTADLDAVLVLTTTDSAILRTMLGSQAPRSSAHRYATPTHRPDPPRASCRPRVDILDADGGEPRRQWTWIRRDPHLASSGDGRSNGRRQLVYPRRSAVRSAQSHGALCPGATPEPAENGSAAPERAADRVFVERTTGFDPPTLSWQRHRTQQPADVKPLVAVRSWARAPLPGTPSGHKSARGGHPSSTALVPYLRVRARASGRCPPTTCPARKVVPADRRISRPRKVG